MFISKEAFIDKATKRILKRQKAIKRYQDRSEARTLKIIQKTLNKGKEQVTIKHIYLSKESLDRIVNIIETQYPYLILIWSDPDFYDHCEYTFTAAVKKEDNDESI